MKNRLTGFYSTTTNGWTVHDRSGWRYDRMVEGSRKVQQKNVLVEGYKKELKVVAEGHSTLRREIAGVAKELKEEIQQVDRKVDLIGPELRELRARMDALSKQMSEGFTQIAKLLSEHEKQLQHHVHVS